MVDLRKPVCGWKQQSQGVSKCPPVCRRGAFARSKKWKLAYVGPVERHTEKDTEMKHYFILQRTWFYISDSSL